MKANIATAIIVLLLASSLHNLGSEEVNDLTQEVNLVAKNTNSHEVRVHHLGDSWNDSQQIDWYPLQTDFYRTIQFTIRVDSVANPSDIVSSELTMVWSGNVSSQDATFSVDLISDDFDLVDGIPEAIVNFNIKAIQILGIMKSHCRQLPTMVLYKILNMQASLYSKTEYLSKILWLITEFYFPKTLLLK